MLKKSLFSIALLGTMLFSSVVASASVDAKAINLRGWYYERETSQWSYYVDYHKVINGTIQDNGKVYYFDSNGNLENGTHTYGDTTVTFKKGLAVW